MVANRGRKSGQAHVHWLCPAASRRAVRVRALRGFAPMPEIAEARALMSLCIVQSLVVEAVRARNEMPALVRTPVLPRAMTIGAVSVQLRRPRPRSATSAKRRNRSS